MAKASARGGFNLFWGLAASTVISAVGVIVIARLLSPSEYGLVMVASMALGLVTLFRDWGVNSAMIKYTAQYRSENKASEVKSLLVAGLSFELISGFFLSLILFFLAGFIAANIFNRPETTPLIHVASFTIFAGALLTATHLILFQLPLPSWVELVIGATAFTTSYITVASLKRLSNARNYV
jgi:O-antigen/teichoic acid export membrane protein